MSIRIQNMSEKEKRLLSDLTMKHLSQNFIIPTKNILSLEFCVRQWIATGVIGGCVWGPPRIGKTHAMKFISERLQERFGENFPSFIWNITEHPDTEKSFYVSIMMALGFDVKRGGTTALYVKDRLINTLTVMANETCYKTVVMFIDEAWLLSIGDFSRLMDLYNNLALRQVHLCCFLFGTKELRDLKDAFKRNSKTQILGRFMVHEKQFSGLQNETDLAFCLVELDQKKMILENGEEDSTSISEFYFPYADGMSFYSLAHDFWSAFQKVRTSCGLEEKDVPMQYFMESFILCLERYGVLGYSPVYFPTEKELYDCVIDSGYGESDARASSSSKN